MSVEKVRGVAMMKGYRMAISERVLFSAGRAHLLWRVLTPVMILTIALAGCGDEGADTGSEADTGSDAPDVGEEPVGPAVRFEPSGEGFYRMPWPADSRRTEAGTLALSDFGELANNNLLNAYVKVIEDAVEGFSLMPVVYVPFTEEVVAREAIPSPLETLEEGAAVELVDLSETGCGERVPVEVRIVSGRKDRYEAAHRLMAAPVYGATLHPARTYGLIVRDFLQGVDGSSVRVPERLFAALAGDDADPALNAMFEPLRTCLPGIERDSGVIAATVFTTQDPVDEILRVRTALYAENFETIDPASAELWSEQSYGNWTTWRSTFEAPIFLRGEAPWADSGGGFVFGEDGLPVVQTYESIPFTLSIPNEGEGPFPVLIWLDGTGANLASPIGDGWFRGAIDEGFAVASFLAPLHGERAVPGSDEILHTFNFLNPEAGRSVFRQEVAELMYFVRWLRELAPAQFAGIAELSTEELMYGGHSQGGIVGAIAAGVEPEIDAWVLNGTGAYLSVTITERLEPLNVAATVALLLGSRSDLDRFHPLVSVAQTGAEVVDPHSYIRRWRGSVEDPDGTHVFVINGDEDPTTPQNSVDHLTRTAFLPVLSPAGWSADPVGYFGLASPTLPVVGNVLARDGSALTQATWLEGGGGHFTIYRNATVRDLGVTFWRSALDGAPLLAE